MTRPEQDVQPEVEALAVLSQRAIEQMVVHDQYLAEAALTDDPARRDLLETEARDNSLEMCDLVSEMSDLISCIEIVHPTGFFDDDDDGEES
jgi:hypothetical protein